MRTDRPGLWCGGAVLALLVFGGIAVGPFAPPDARLPVQVIDAGAVSAPAERDAVTHEAMGSAAPAPVVSIETERSLVCGMPASKDNGELTGAELNDSLDASATLGLAQLVHALATTSGNDIDRAMRFVLMAYLPRSEPFAPFALGASDARSEARSEASGDPQAVGDTLRSATESLARLALASNDARVYGLAAMQCGRGDAAATRSAQDGACGQIDLWTWALKDPGNAAPWLLLAQRARSQGDADTVDQAMTRAAQAHKFDYGAFEFLKLIDHPAVRALKPATRVATYVALTGLWVSWPTPGHAAGVAWCPAGEMDINREQACGDLARMLVSRSSAMVDLTLGVHLAEQVGWPAAEREQALQQRQAYLDALAAAMPKSPPMGCQWMHDYARWARQIGREGEVAMARRLVAASASASAFAPARPTAQPVLRSPAAMPLIER